MIRCKVNLILIFTWVTQITLYTRNFRKLYPFPRIRQIRKYLLSKLRYCFPRKSGYIFVLTPILRQPPRSRSSQHRLAKAFEQGGDARQSVVQGIDARQCGVEFVGDAALFIKWCKGDRNC
ncbi:hypothetical protein BMF29_09295 [Comamonas kerstersii]|nr:hypothetical protein BMF38_12815 [Comamonas kerstersii]OOH92029.1 hypothetical protein BMF29_09295 [Comamonas kerstersii]